MKDLDIINKTFPFNLGKLEIEPTYWQAFAIIFLIFSLILSLSRLRHMYVNWSLGKSAIAMLFWGFILAVIVEGFLILSGRTLLTTIVGWENAPKPIAKALDLGRDKLIQTLGVSDETKKLDEPSAYDLIIYYQSLGKQDAEIVNTYICTP